MRSQQLTEALEEAVQRDLGSDASIIRFFLSKNIHGGWEGWLQTVYAHALINGTDDEITDFEREVTYPGTALRSDLRFTGRRGTETYIELKTQRHATYRNTVKDFKQDVTKIGNLGREFLQTNVCMALAVLVVHDADKADLSAYQHGGKLKYSQYRPGEKWVVTDNVTAVPTGSLALLSWTTK